MGSLQHWHTAGEPEAISRLYIWVELPKEASKKLQYPPASFILDASLRGHMPSAVLCDVTAVV